jgi:hypothetical protein
MADIGISVPDILLPRPGTDLSRWAVVACDQFTSQPAYWEAVEAFVGDAPSTLRITFPEVYLGPDDGSRIASIRAAMRNYVDRQLFVLHHEMILVERTTAGPHGPQTRTGLMAAVDLEHYDYSAGSRSLVRATEGTILDRLPPRIRIREGAPLELPHVMLLIDDPDRTVIEPLAARRQALRTVYDVELMQGGGHVTGRALDSEATGAAMAAMGALARPDAFAARYGLTGSAGAGNDRPVLLFAVGDGNHSLATAKAVWERLKPTLSAAEREAHPARHALAEIVNVHDEGLLFEPIHRVLFGVQQDLLEKLRTELGDALRFTATPPADAIAIVQRGPTQPGAHTIAMVSPDRSGVLEFLQPTQNLPVATLQPRLDAFLAAGGASSIDYVHGTEAVLELGLEPGHLGLYLPGMAKSELFRTVILDGVLPRKTFSMGEAHEKRYYLECRRILP